VLVLPRRVAGRPLGPGTYRVRGRAASGRRIATVTVVVTAATSPTRAQLAAARRRDVCGAAVSGEALRAFVAGLLSAVAVASGEAPVAPAEGASATPASGSSAAGAKSASGLPLGAAGASAHGGVLGTAETIVTSPPRPLEPLLLLALVLAIAGGAALAWAVVDYIVSLRY
jgi:hypothetical protein